VSSADETAVSRLCHDSPVSVTDRPVAARRRRVRLDQLLVERGLAETRSRAQALVMAGKVRVGEGDSARADRKAGDLVDPATPLRLLAPEPYVSRGGHKLAAALDAFSIDPTGLVCLDVGASTGGFSDVLLQRGAARVYALDVGRGQLADSVRRDPRVIVMDRVNARNLDADAIPEPLDLAVVDVSFISLGLVLGPVVACLRPEGRVVPLVKPQFEAGRGQVKGGVVRDPAVHRSVLERIVGSAAGVGLGTAGVIASPILGPEGNREFLLDLHLGRGPAPNLASRLDAVVMA
jgi:23S rRNA (cytidine1920-2'-O)/16S rRNA (cytidine1409-2'-O)-methyltransferase